MKILSWNVNGIRAIAKKGFLDWLEEESPDLLALQETKAHKEQLDSSLLSPPNYHTYWASAEKKGYSGTAIFSKQEPLSVKYGIGEELFDQEGRVLTLEFPSFFFLSCYFPNSQEERKRLDYKLAFCQALSSFLDELQSKKHIIVSGDFNIAHQAIDLAHPDRNENSPGYYFEERAWMDSFLSRQHRDTFRHFYPEKIAYSWWSYRTRARERNVGWRIDYLTVNEEFLTQIEDAHIYHDVMGSDHCPVGIKLKS